MQAGLVRLAFFGLLLCATVIGVLVAIVWTPINLIILGGWICWLWRSKRRPRGKLPDRSPPGVDDEIDGAAVRGKPGRAWTQAIVAMQVAIVATIVLVAGALPVKAVDRVMNRSVTLPKTTMTLGEFAELRYTVSLGPLYHFAPEPEDDSLMLHFPRNRMRLGEVIAVVEKQTPYRRELSYCATGSTILWGHPGVLFSLELTHPRGQRDAAGLVLRAIDDTGASVAKPRKPEAAVEGPR